MEETKKQAENQPCTIHGVVSRRFGIVKATKDQLESIGILDVPSGVRIEICEIDEYQSDYGSASRMRYNSKYFEYIIPTLWVA